MLKLLIVSDSHGASQAILALLACAVRREGGVSRLIHLGDGERDGERLAKMLDLPLTEVRGNCDESSLLPDEITLMLNGVKILLRHGHQLDVKSTLLRLLMRAREVGAGVALYGHTHLARADRDEGVLLLNPGALMGGHYALLCVENGIASFDLRVLALRPLG